MDRYLIINADDFGMCHAGNMAVMDLFAKGGITSSTIMAPCSWSREAAVWAAQHPEYAVGVHLTTTSEWGNYRWGPVANGDTSSLRDEDGYFWHESDQFEDHFDLDQVEAEIRAQVEKLKGFGLNPSHLDNHMGSLYGIEGGHFETLQKTFEICAEYGLPFRFPGKFTDEMLSNAMLDIKIDPKLILAVFSQINAFVDELGVPILDYLVPGDWNGPQKDSFANYRDYIFEMYAHFPEGVIETYIHPALESDELKAITGSWERRVWEYNLFADPKTREYITKDLGIKLINYRDLKAMRAK